MKNRLKQINMAIFSLAIIPNLSFGQSTSDSQVYPNGANGDVNFILGSPVELIGGQSYGVTGGVNKGSDSNSVENKKIIINNSEVLGFSGASGTGGLDVNSAASGLGGYGGASVFGGISIGGLGGFSFYKKASDINGGNSGNVSLNIIEISNSKFTGGEGGNGGEVNRDGVGTSSGSGGAGGGSVFGGVSVGGLGGAQNEFEINSTGNGGDSGNSIGNVLTVSGSSFIGARGGDGGDIHPYGLNSVGGAGGFGGFGGGSFFGGLSVGGNAGYVLTEYGNSIANGGKAGNVTGHKIQIKDSTFIGAAGGDGGSVVAGVSGGTPGASGSGGSGGGSIFGGVSTGGSGGRVKVGNGIQAIGGSAGDTSFNQISLINVNLDGSNASGGNGGAAENGPGGNGGHGGGSVFGGLSTGGNGGFGRGNADGGSGGQSSNNKIYIDNVKMVAGSSGSGGASINALSGKNGLPGGSIFGGVSYGGSGGYISLLSSTTVDSSVNGGMAGESSNNEIYISGNSSISGDIYGGLSHGGSKGVFKIAGVDSGGVDGKGYFAQNNNITLSGENIIVGGSIYGGRSINGDGLDNIDKEFVSYYKGNTINFQGFRGAVNSIYNFQNYNWSLSSDVKDGQTIVQINGNAVEIDNTIHTVAVASDGNQFLVGDKVILMDKVIGNPATASSIINEGFFVTYNGELGVDGDDLVLKIVGEVNDKPAGRINPRAKALLEGRAAAVAMINQGADMISNYGIDAALAQRDKNTNLFVVVDGGSNKYKTGSHIKVHDVKFALGVAKGFELKDKSAVTVGAFFEHGQGNYDSYNSFDGYRDVHGYGDLRYTGAGVLLHVDVAGTGSKNRSQAAEGAKDGLYLKAALRAGRSKKTFDSHDFLNAQGQGANYDAKSDYFSVMAGAGYVMNLDAKQALDMYGRYTWSRLGGDDVVVRDEALKFGAVKSSRLRLGIRYNYTASDSVKPYVGVAYEREFSGDISGSAAGFNIKQPEFKGNTGIVEAGVLVHPVAGKDAWSIHAGVQGYFSKRKGASAGVKIKYAF